MLRLSLRNLRAHARRFTSTIVAVALGIAFLSGVLMLTATFQKSFDDMLATGTADTDAVVRASESIDLGFGDSARGEIDASLEEQIASVDGVRAVAPVRQGMAQIEASDGDIVGGGGPPQIGAQWTDVDALNPWVLSDGRAPDAPEEVVIDAASARQGDLAVGDTTRVFTPEPVEVTVVGVARYGTSESPGPLTYALFSEQGALAHLVGGDDKVDSFVIEGEPGLTQREVVDAVTAELPDGVEAITGEQLTDETQQIGRDFVDLLRPALLAFALIALIVGAFSIYNTFAIVVAQRTRDAALLRALGASRRQVVGATLVEAAIVGIVGSGFGLLAGMGLASLLSAAMGSFSGVEGASLVVEASTVVTAFVVGTGVTVAAALLPARRASFVPPVAALREVAVDGGRVGRIRPAVGAAVLALGAGLGVTAAVNESSANQAAAGAALLLVAAIILAPTVAGPVVRALGAPVARVRGVTGVMARRNAIRNPRRTGSTSTALIIGVSVVALFAVIGASVRASLDDVIDEQIAGDVVVQGADMDGFTGLAPSLQTALADLPETDTAVGIGGIPISFDGEDTFISFADAALLDRAVDLGISEGELADFGTGDVAVSDGYAEEHGLGLGDTIPVRHIDGADDELTVALTYETTALAGPYFVDETTVAPHVPQVGPNVMILRAADGVTPEQLDRAAQDAAEAWPGTSIETRAEFAETQGRMVDQMLMLIYVLLALSIGIALMGIANTISLSTLERRHEIGLLRAVGQTRSQVRSMVRWEAVLVALIGTLVGMGVGVVSAWMVFKGAGGEFNTIALPGTTLVVVAVVGAAAGVLASARPARRAARADVLAAIASA